MGDRTASGNRIRLYRERAGLSQVELAERAGLKPSTVSNWEQGLAYPQYRGIKILCKIFGCSADDLLGLPAVGLTADESELLAQIRRLDDDGLHTVRAVIDSQLLRLGK